MDNSTDIRVKTLPLIENTYARRRPRVTTDRPFIGRDVPYHWLLAAQVLSKDVYDRWIALIEPRMSGYLTRPLPRSRSRDG